MYPYDYLAQLHPVEPNEIFVAMPFDAKHDDIYEKLIEPSVAKANILLKRSPPNILRSYRTKDDPSTINGWEEVLKHLTSAGFVIGILTDSNPNVFYELGIAHATQPLKRQILLAPNNYKSEFDVKDMIATRYDLGNIDLSIEELATKIDAAVRESQRFDDERLHRVKRMLGPREFAVAMQHGYQSNFAFRLIGQAQNFNHELEATAGAMGNLCRLGLLALNTALVDKQKGGLHFSYWWTRLGNEVLALKDFGVIDQNEVEKRKGSAPC